MKKFLPVFTSFITAIAFMTIFAAPVYAATLTINEQYASLFLDYAQLYIFTLNILLVVTSVLTILLLIIFEILKKFEWRNKVVSFVIVNTQALVLVGIVFLTLQLFAEEITSWTDLDKFTEPLTWKATYLYFLVGFILLIESFLKFKMIDKFRSVLRFYGATMTISFMLFLTLYFIIL